ncbi:DUF523 domain-containing protein [Vibrio kasasachensis]|uniref:DUF523 domain-containing protein n=1 Tax=Vibrio kasasachensis TaxID=2910248 RepID=UPI003D12140E
MEKVLVSSCLAGNKVRYNASCLSIPDQDWDWLNSNVEMVVFCPEVSGGLPTPRAPAEIINGKGVDVVKGFAHVVGNDGVDVTEPFLLGAQKTLEICQQHGIKYAILAEGSPSCGSSKIYDGTFSGNKIEGFGVTTAVLTSEGIKVFSQHTVKMLKIALETDN